jgi:hypothetical protein
VSRYTLPSTDLKDPLSRLSLDDGPDDDDLVTLAEEEVTSRNHSAAVANIRNAIDLSTDQALWLYQSLARLLVGQGVLPVSAQELAEDWYEKHNDGTPRTNKEVIRALTLLIEGQRAEGERAGMEQCPAKPTDTRVIYRALGVLLSTNTTYDAKKYDLTLPEMERANELFLFLDSQFAALQKLKNGSPRKT